jgi:glutaredoxin
MMRDSNTPMELVMYTRTLGCPFITIAKQVLSEENVPYREIFIDRDPVARQRVRDWTGFLSVPTLVVAHPGSDLPIEVPAPLPNGQSPQGVDRDFMITEPRDNQLRAWLYKYGFID